MRRVIPAVGRTRLEEALAAGYLLTRSARTSSTYWYWCSAHGVPCLEVSRGPVWAKTQIDLEPAGRRFSRKVEERIGDLLKREAGQRWICYHGQLRCYVTRIPAQNAVAIALQLRRIVMEGPI